MTLDALRKEFRKELFAKKHGKPTQCPVCDHAHRVYKRKLNSGMAAKLIEIYKLGGAKHWVNVADIFPGVTHRGGEWALLRHWKVLEPRDVRTAVENAHGDWRITVLGRLFVQNRARVPRYVYVFEGEKIGASSERTTIKEALGDGFNYLELMGGSR